MFFYFKSISLNLSALTGKSNTAADLHIQAAFSLNYTPGKNHIPLAFIPTCYIEWFSFALPPQKKIGIRRAWIIVAFQETMMNFISVQSILHEFIWGLYSELTYVLQSCHFKLLIEWCWVVHSVSLYGYSPFLVGWWVGIKPYLLWWESIQSLYFYAYF